VIAVINVIDVNRDRRRKAETIGEFNLDSGQGDYRKFSFLGFAAYLGNYSRSPGSANGGLSRRYAWWNTMPRP